MVIVNMEELVEAVYSDPVYLVARDGSPSLMEITRTIVEQLKDITLRLDIIEMNQDPPL